MVAALVSLAAGRGGGSASWSTQLAGALDLAAASCSRVYVHWTGGWAATTLTQEGVKELSIAYDCLPAAAPQLDVVPLIPFAGWTPERLGALPDVSTLLLPRPCAEHDEGEADKARSLIVAARRAAGLPELTPVQCDLGPRPKDMERPNAGNPPGSLTFPGVAVGGTFDRLHAGHRLLLSVAALSCTSTVYVGVAGDKLLEKKPNAHLLWPFEQRVAAAEEFLHRVRPDLKVEVSALLDPKTPPKAATMREITALVISRETVAGGHKVLEMRRDAGIEDPLALILVDLVGAASQQPQAHKLSSSELREQEATSS